ncbi:CAP domain-containing protein [Tropicimonas marinistellae]|uniref:CAP domain-containing protein n=1 Tax=Tropicimonas marinistellae TaxID=1739787 RepID=UPI0008298906|nr:CAP domain-containing protein [Tropicimonas marinistellae]
MTQPDGPMIRPVCRVLALALTVLVVLNAEPADAARSCARAPVSGVDQPVDPKRIDQRRLNAAILSEVNYLRCRKGLSQLAAPGSLQKVAAGHSRWMASKGRLTHMSDRRGKQTPKDRVVSTGLVKRMGSENIAKVSLYRLDEVGRFRIDDAAACRFRTTNGNRIGPHTYGSLARYVANLWYNSSKHRKNLMDGRARMTGTGASFDARGRNCGNIYLTQNFAG